MSPPQDINYSCVAPVDNWPLFVVQLLERFDQDLAVVGLVDFVDFGVFSGESGNGKAKSDPSEVSELSSAFS